MASLGAKPRCPRLPVHTLLNTEKASLLVLFLGHKGVYGPVMVLPGKNRAWRQLEEMIQRVFLLGPIFITLPVHLLPSLLVEAFKHHQTVLHGIDE